MGSESVTVVSEPHSVPLPANPYILQYSLLQAYKFFATIIGNDSEN